MLECAPGCREADSADGVLALLRATERDERTWRVAALAAADARQRDLAGPATIAEAKRLWLAYPARRDMVLYLLALATQSSSRYGLTWPEFAKQIGPPPTPAEVGRCVAYGPRAFPVAVALWPLLSPGARTAELVKRLDDFADRAKSYQLRPGEPTTTIDEIADALVAALQYGELAAWHAWIVQRRAARPGEAASLAHALERTGRRPAPPPARRVATDPADPFRSSRPSLR